MSFFAVLALMAYFALDVLCQPGPYATSYNNGTYTNPILNLQGAADPSDFQDDSVAPAMADLDVAGLFDTPMAGII
jgi:hypothetical protein